MAGTSQESRLAIVIDTAGAERRIEELRRQLRELGGAADDTTNNSDRLNNANNRLSQSTSRLSKVMGLAAKAMKYGGAAISGIAVAAIKVSGDFEEAMNGVRAVSGAVGEDFNQMRELAKKMGSETAFSATEAANGMEFLAMAGMNTEQIMSTIPNALSLAAAGSIELAQSADILSNIMTGMGLAAEDSARAADVLAQTAAAANVDISMMGESMKYVAPIAKQLGMSLEETAAMAGILGNAGIQGSEAGTALRAVYSRFATDNKALKHFDALGIKIKNSSGEMKSMTDLVGELAVAMDGMGADERLNIFKEMAGTEAMSALAVSVDAMADGSLPNLISKLETADGAAKRMADTRMEGLNGAIKSAKSAAEGFLIALGDSGLLNLATGAVTALAGGIRQLSEWLPQASADITAFFQSAEVATALEMTIDGLQAAWSNLNSVIRAAADILAPVVGFFKEHNKLSEALAISIGLVAGAFVVYNAAVAIGTAVTGGFVAALALLTSPVTLTIAALTALTAAGVYLYQNWDEIKAKAVSIWGSITSYIGNKIDTIKSYFSTNFPAMTAIVSGQIGIVKSVIVGGFELISNAIKTTLAVIKAVIKGDFGAIPAIIGAGLKGAVAIVGDMMGNILNIIKSTGTKLYQVGKDLVQGLINGIKSSVSGVTNAISDMASSAIAKAKSVLDIRSPSRKMKKVGEQTAEGMAVGIKKGTKKVVTEAQRMAEQAIKAVDDAIASYQKRITLFGDNSELSSLLYDINAGKYKGASDARIGQLVKEATALHNLETQLKATNAVQERFDKWREERDKMRSNATDLIRGRMDKFNKDKASSSDNLQGMLSSLEQETPLGKIQADYEARLELIEQYENTHTDMLETAKEARLAVEQSYMDAKRDLMLTQGEELFGDLSDLAKGFAGEQSGIYRALFAVEKGFAIAQSAIAIQQSIAKAMALGFPQNIPVIATAMSQGATLMSNIQGITPKGFKTGGYTGNIGTNSVAGVVHGQEYVFDAQATRRIGVDNLNAMRRGDKVGGDVNITVNNMSSARVETQKDDNGNIIMTIRDEIKRSWTNTGNPNSFESKQLNRNIQAPRRR